MRLTLAVGAVRRRHSGVGEIQVQTERPGFKMPQQALAG